MDRFTHRAVVCLEEERQDRLETWQQAIGDIAFDSSRADQQLRANQQLLAADHLLAFYEARDANEVARKIKWLLMNAKFRSVIVGRMGPLDMAYVALVYIQFGRRFGASQAGADKLAMESCLAVLEQYFAFHSGSRTDLP